MGGQGGLAKDLRAGLNQENQLENQTVGGVAQSANGKLDKLYFGKPIRQHISEFCDLLALLVVGLAAWHLYKGGALEGGLRAVLVGFGLRLLGQYLPGAVYPVWKAWMFLAEKLGVVSTFLILTVAWFFMVIPLGILMRIFKAKVMDLSFRVDKASYWETRNPKNENFKLLERQF